MKLFNAIRMRGGVATDAYLVFSNNPEEAISLLSEKISKGVFQITTSWEIPTEATIVSTQVLDIGNTKNYGGRSGQ